MRVVRKHNHPSVRGEGMTCAHYHEVILNAGIADPVIPNLIARLNLTKEVIVEDRAAE